MTPLPTGHERNLRGGKTQVRYEALVAALAAIQETEAAFLDVASDAYPYIRSLEEEHPKHPNPVSIEPATLRMLYFAMHDPVPDWSLERQARPRARTLPDG